MHSQRITNPSDHSFEQDVLHADKPVLVDYWATWCGPCKAISPLLDEAAEAYADRLQIAKVNIEQCTATPPRYGVRGVPTLMIFKKGQVAATRTGALSKAQLRDFIEAHL
jgi:thioredoxin 1